MVQEEGWKDAASGCQYIIHLSAINEKECKKDQSDLTEKTLVGLKNVLEAARDSGTVKRFLLAGSLAAVQGGLSGEDGKTYTEENWTDPNKKGLHPWAQFKVQAELEAMKFVEGLPDDNKFELCVLHPGLVIGPILTKNAGTSLDIILKMLNGGMPMVPRMCMAVTDVRDFSAAFVSAMTSQHAAGQRYIVCAGTKWMEDIASILHEEFGPMGYKISRRRAPYFLLRIIGFFDSMAKAMCSAIGNFFSFDNSNLVKELKVTPHDINKTVIETGHSLIQREFVKKTDKYSPLQA